MTLGQIALILCRDCLGGSGEYLPCWRCGGEVSQVTHDATVADVIVRIEWTGTDLQMVMEVTPSFRAWLDEVGRE